MDETNLKSLIKTKSIENIPSIHRRYAVFASYTSNGIIGNDVVFYLRELNKITDGIVFIADNEINEEEAKKLDDLTIYYKFERHNEYDFGSYKRGFLYLKESGLLNNANEIIFANDSCYGPLKPLDKFIKKWEIENKPDFYGITVNNYGIQYGKTTYTMVKNPHIQSYFFMVTKSIFEKDFFVNFMNSIKSENSKNSVIYKYEIGLSDEIKKNNFKIASYFIFKNEKENPTLIGKKLLYTIRNGFFIKKTPNKHLPENIINYYLAKSKCPYSIEKGNVTEKKPLNKIIFKYILSKILFILKNSFNVRNSFNDKLIIIFGMHIRIKRKNK